MKNIELKNCPNCNKRIGIHDVECPYCKHIDDPRYKKHNEKIIKPKKKRKKKTNIYLPLLIIPIISYLVYLIFKINSFKMILPLILLNIMCFFTKNKWTFGVILIEIIVLIFNLIKNIINNTSFNDLKMEILLFILGIIFLIIPKIIYIIKSKKKKRKSKKM